MKNIALLLIIAVASFGCARLSDEGFDPAKLSADVSRGAVVSLADYTSFQWDRVHIFSPHTPAETVKSEVGKSVPYPHRDSEGWCLLVFLSGREVVSAFEVERTSADFAHLFRAGGYSQEEAVFDVEVRPADGWRQLKKRGLR